ncbi:MAG: hypothetical protein R2712_21095 [Vicinamibacterales bacterium]
MSPALVDLSHIRFHPGSPAGVTMRGERRPWRAPRGPLLHVPDKVTGVAERVLRLAGLQPAMYRSASLRRRTPACLRALRVPTADDALALLEQRPEQTGTALTALLVGVSEFFRDPRSSPFWRARSCRRWPAGRARCGC